MNVRLLLLTALMAGLPSVVSAQAVSPTDASAQALTNEQLTKELRELKNLLKEVLNEQQRQGLSNGRLKNQMQDPQFARDFGDAVHTTLRRSGTLVVSNRMATDQYLIVNGTQHRVLAVRQARNCSTNRHGFHKAARTRNCQLDRRCTDVRAGY